MFILLLDLLCFSLPSVFSYNLNPTRTFFYSLSMMPCVPDKSCLNALYNLRKAQCIP